MNLLRDLILLVLLLFLSVSLKMNSRRHWKALPLTPASSENRAQKQVHSRKSCAKILDLLTYCMIHTQTYSPTKNRTETKLSLFQIFFLLWKFQEFMMELFRWVNLHFRPPAFFSKWFISFREIIRQCLKISQECLKSSSLRSLEYWRKWPKSKVWFLPW